MPQQAGRGAAGIWLAGSREAGHPLGRRPALPTETGMAENIRSAEVENPDIYAGVTQPLQAFSSARALPSGEREDEVSKAHKHLEQHLA